MINYGPDRRLRRSFFMSTQGMTMRLSDFGSRMSRETDRVLSDRFLFDLGSTIGPGRVNQPGEVRKIETLLDLTGDIVVPREFGPSGGFGDDMREGVRAFQRREGLVDDGILRPGGPTITRMRDRLGDPLGGVGEASRAAREAGTPVAPDLLANRFGEGGGTRFAGTARALAASKSAGGESASDRLGKHSTGPDPGAHRRQPESPPTPFARHMRGRHLVPHPPAAAPVRPLRGHH